MSIKFEGNNLVYATVAGVIGGIVVLLFLRKKKKKKKNKKYITPMHRLKEEHKPGMGLDLDAVEDVLNN